MAQIYETHTVKERDVVHDRPKSSVNAWLAFLVGALLIAFIGFFFFSAHGSVSVTPQGTSGSFNVKPPVQTAPSN